MINNKYTESDEVNEEMGKGKRDHKVTHNNGKVSAGGHNEIKHKRGFILFHLLTYFLAISLVMAIQIQI